MSKENESKGSKLSRQAERVLGHLLRLASPEGEVVVLLPQLARELGVSLSTVKRARRELIKAGELEEVERGGGRGKPSKYRVTRVAPEPKKEAPACPQETGVPQAVSTQVREEKPGQVEPVLELVRAAAVALDPEDWERLWRGLVSWAVPAAIGGFIGGSLAYLFEGQWSSRVVAGICLGVGLGSLLWWLGKRRTEFLYSGQGLLSAPNPAWEKAVTDPRIRVIR